MDNIAPATHQAIVAPSMREPTGEEAKTIEAVLATIFAQVERIDERIEKDQQETARLREETWKILTHLQGR